MFAPSLFAINGALCVAAIWFAALVRHGRREAIILAVALCANFVFCNLAYTEYAPKYAFQAIGLDVNSKDLWFCADALFGVSCLIAYDRWWGWALWLCSGLQLTAHMAYGASMFGGVTYTDILADVLLAQIAIFFVMGGRGAQSLVLDTLAWFSRPRRQVEAAHCEVEE